MENTIKTIKEKQAEKESTQQARQELQGFVAALTARQEQEKKAKEDYIEKKIKQIDARKERRSKRMAERADEKSRLEMIERQAEQARIEAFRSAPLQAGEKVRVKENGMVGEVVKVSAKAVVVAIGNISSKMPLDKVERITSNEYKSAVKDTAKPAPSMKIDASITQRKLNFSTEIDIRG